MMREMEKEKEKGGEKECVLEIDNLGKKGKVGLNNIDENGGE